MKLTILDGSVLLSDMPRIISGSVKRYVIECDLGAEYEGLICKAVFERESKSIEVLIENNEVLIPWEVLTTRGRLRIGVYGVSDDIVKPTLYSDYILIEQGVSESEEGKEPTPTVYEKIVKLVENIKNIAQSVRDDADNGAFKGEKGDKGDPGAFRKYLVQELPVDNIDEDAIYLIKDPNAESDENKYIEYQRVNGEWDIFGTSVYNIDLSEYVKKTDYATNSVFGLVKGNRTFGINIENGELYVQRALEEDIDKKESAYKCVTPSKLDYAVMKALTNPLKHEWTEEEKASALAQLGGVANLNTKNRIYATNSNGENASLTFSSGVVGGSIAYRDGNGCTSVGTPTADTHATSKAYVDGLIAQLQAQIDELKGQ